TRGVGRGTALALGEAGATVYCTGRSTRTKKTMRLETPRRGSAEARKALPADYYKNRPETIEETAEMVSARGGQGIPVVVDHLEPEKVEKLISRIRREQGEWHVLVNDTSESPEHEFGNPSWQAFTMARELRRKNVAAIALTPGFLRSEIMLEHFGVSEANWRDAVGKNPDYITSETPLFSGRAIAALAADPKIMQKSGRVFSSWGLSEEYDFCDRDGSHPHWGRYFREKYGDCLKPCDGTFYEYWSGGPMDTIYANWP